MGFGAKFARGCTSGQALTGGALLVGGQLDLHRHLLRDGLRAVRRWRGGCGDDAVLTETGSLGATGRLVAAPPIGVRLRVVSRARRARQRPQAGRTVLSHRPDRVQGDVQRAPHGDAGRVLAGPDLACSISASFTCPRRSCCRRRSAGALFGAGFLIAGLCPGTSCVAAAAGQLDGLAVVGGMLLGVLVFNAGYSRVEGLYNSTALGAVTMSRSARLSRGRRGCGVTAAALGGFAAVGEPVRAAPATPGRDDAVRVSPARRGLAVVAAASRHSPPPSANLTTGRCDLLAVEIDAERDHMTAPDLAGLIMRGDPALRIFDLRSPAEFARMHFPGASHATLETLAREPLPRDATIVLYSEGGAHAAQAWVLLRMRGYRRRVLPPRRDVRVARARHRATAGRRCDCGRARGFRACRGDEPVLRRACTRRRGTRGDPGRLLELGSRGDGDRPRTVVEPNVDRWTHRRHPEAWMLMRAGLDAAALRSPRVRATRRDRMRLSRLRRRGALSTLARSRATPDGSRRRVIGNPHSESGPSQASTEAIDEARALTLQLLDADPRHYDVDLHRQRQRRAPHCRGRLPVPIGFPSRAHRRQSQLGERHPRPCPPSRCDRGLHAARRRASRHRSPAAT